ncbi:MAG: amidohydrolase family protein [Rubripirellula sp.]
MILTGQLLIEDGSGGCHLQPGHVRLDGEIIAEISLNEPPPKGDRSIQDVFGGHDCLICPGFIDAHLHLSQFGIIGAHGLPLLRWLAEFTFPEENKWNDPELAASTTATALEELLSHGTTGIAAYATVHHEATWRCLQVAEQKGVRALIGQVLMDCNAPASLCRPAAQLLNEAESLGAKYPPNRRVAAAVTPRFALSCSEELLRGSGKLATEQQATIQTHIAETKIECQQVQRQFGKPYSQVYRDAGLLTERSLFGHGIYLDPLDRQQLAAANSKIVHCPTANSFLRSGEMNRQTLAEESIQLAIGSDIGAGYERSMVRVARGMILTAARLGTSVPSASEAWYSITAGNADALSWLDAGRLRVGACADLLIIRPSIDWQSANSDPLSKLMFGWDDRWIQHVFLRGKLARSYN